MLVKIGMCFQYDCVKSHKLDYMLTETNTNILKNFKVFSNFCYETDHTLCWWELFICLREYSLLEKKLVKGQTKINDSTFYNALKGELAKIEFDKSRHVNVVYGFITQWTRELINKIPIRIYILLE